MEVFKEISKSGMNKNISVPFFEHKTQISLEIYTRAEISITDSSLLLSSPLPDGSNNHTRADGSGGCFHSSASFSIPAISVSSSITPSSLHCHPSLGRSITPPLLILSLRFFLPFQRPPGGAEPAGPPPLLLLLQTPPPLPRASSR